MHREIIRRYKVYCAQQSFRISALLSIVLFAGSLFVQAYAVHFANERVSNRVSDLILSNTPAFDVGYFFVYGMILLIAVITLLCLTHPKRIPFVLYSLTLFIVIRSVFVSLTHLAPFESHFTSNFSDAITSAFYGSDLFFSGHTGTPFLMALVFWNDIRLRYIFLAWSFFFAGVVLLGHLHYTIDVLAAFFITFSIYHIALWLFHKDRLFFLSEM